MLNEIFNMEKILGACERFLYFLKINFFFLLILLLSSFKSSSIYLITY